MPSPIQCPACKKQFAARPELIGKKIKCPKCATPFTIPAPPASDPYDLLPSEPPPPRPAPTSPVAPAKKTDAPNYSKAAANTLKVAGTTALRHGPINALIALVLAGGFVAIWKKPKILFYLFCFFFGGLLLIIAGGYAVSKFSQPPAFHAPAPPPFPGPPPVAMPGGPPHGAPFPASRGPQPMPPGMPVGRGPTTPEQLAAQYGNDHVFRLNVSNVHNFSQDIQSINAYMTTVHSPANISRGTGTTATCYFVPSDDFDTCIKKITFGQVTASDPASHTIEVTLPN